MTLKFLSDDPLREPGNRHQDGLGFGVYATALANGISSAAGSMTIGVTGEWGAGKTSLMHLIEDQLAQNEDTLTVWFNAWRYEQEEHPVVALIGTIVNDLVKESSRSENFKSALSNFIDQLRAVAYGFTLKATLGVPGLASAETSVDPKKMIDRGEALAALRNESLLDRSLFHSAFEKLDSADIGDLKIVVFVDDLDRCFPDQAIKLLESIKLVLSQVGFSFVLGLSSQVLDGYLAHRYRTQYGMQDFHGKAYLDKMMQLSFAIPPSLNRMHDFCREILNGQPPEVAVELSAVLPVIGTALEGNPRAVKRFLNNLLVDISINQIMADATQPHLSANSPLPLIPVHFFAITRCLQQKWPDLFEQIMDSPELASEMAHWGPDEIRDRSQQGRHQGAALMLAGRPALRAIMLGVQGKNWLADETLRRASVDFLISQSRISVASATQVYDAALVCAPDNSALVSPFAASLVDHGGVSLLFDDKEESLERLLHGAEIRTLLVCWVSNADPGQAADADLANYVELLRTQSQVLRGWQPRILLVLVGPEGTIPDALKAYDPHLAWRDPRDTAALHRLVRLSSAARMRQSAS